MPLAFTAVVFLASAAIASFLIDFCGLPIRPFAVLPVSAIASAGALAALGRATDTSGTVPFLAVVSAMLAWLLWLARPSLLPLGSGPDLTHHLALIDYIEVNWRLPHNPHLAAVLGEMANYTPGAHLLAALAGAWTGTDGLHTIYTVVSVTVALKAGVILLIARSMTPSTLPRTPLALSAVLLLFEPRGYFIGSFTEASYLAQVVSELFAVSMWLAIVLWLDHPSLHCSLLIAVCGAATFLAWPVALGPVLLLAIVAMVCRRELTLVARMRHLATATAPIALVALAHSAGRTGAAAIVSGAGYVSYLRADLFGWGFLVAATIGLVTAAFDRRSRTVTVLFAAVALQSAALFVVARRAGSERPYMALKMVYLAIYPMAVAGAVAFAHLLAAAEAGGSRIRGIGGTGRIAGLGAAGIVLVLVIGAVRSAMHLTPPKPAVSQPLFLAGAWARANLDAHCVDYVADNVYSAYWLHIAVMRNARAAPRSMDDDTYQPEKERVRWIEPDGFPYAIAQDFDQLPKDLRTNVDVVARFGPAAIIKRRGRATCAE